MDWGALLSSLAASPATPFVTFVAGGVCGFVATRLTMTKAEQKTVDQKNYENSLAHRRAMEERYVSLKTALETYIPHAESPTLDDFQKISGAAELYFGELKIISDAILGNKVDRHSRDNSFVPHIAEAMQKVIPTYYETLQKIAKKVGLPYGGKFERTNYESLFLVVEKYASTAVLPAVTDRPRARRKNPF